ncbi:hypothetical protein C0Q70_04490 [Pomacea canaliculata]|uniref:Uncharacterized protein n=1 Tax=Pomacea canaliculata TaxID=400727 RepID=A0A2T7PIJ8_POMCA|nr:hypothetical protein C0Q70_04490 [Pomacea canaliculata]
MPRQAADMSRKEKIQDSRFKIKKGKHGCRTNRHRTQRPTAVPPQRSQNPPRSWQTTQAHHQQPADQRAVGEGLAIGVVGEGAAAATGL